MESARSAYGKQESRGLEVGRQLLAACAKAPFDQSVLDRIEPIIEDGPDWVWVFNTAFTNRMFPFLRFGLLRYPDIVPGNVREFLEQEYGKVTRRNLALLGVAREVTGALDGAGIPAIVMRGVSFLETIYGGRMGIRDFGDVDLLVRRRDLASAKACLRGLGLGPLPGALDDRYYERHHLHLAWSRGGATAAVEVHWSLDHKYTWYAIDTEAVFERSRWEVLPNSRLLVMDKEDTLIAACVHAFKHAPLVRHYWDRLAWARPAFPDRHVVHLADIVGLLSHHGGPDWSCVLERCRRWRSSEAVWAILRHAQGTLDAPVPEEVLSELTPPSSGWLERRMAKLGHTMTLERASLGVHEAAVARLFRYRRGLVFDPVRLVDLSGYLFPSVERAKLRWGCGTSAAAVLRMLWHLARSSASLGRNLIDAMYYGAKRRLRGPRRKHYHSPLHAESS